MDKEIPPGCKTSPRDLRGRCRDPRDHQLPSGPASMPQLFAYHKRRRLNPLPW